MLYEIAECIVEYEPFSSFLRKKMETYRLEDAKGREVDISLSITEDYCKERQRENPHLTAAECEYVFAGSEFYRKLMLKGGMMLHASAVEVDGRAYLFSARSGTGKSTHTKLWQRIFGQERAVIINDDKPALKKTEEGWMVYGTPFSGKTDENINKKVALQGICMLARGKENRIWRAKTGEAIPLLMQQTLLSRNLETADTLLTLLDALFREVPIFQMECTISEEAAHMAYEMMKEEERK